MADLRLLTLLAIVPLLSGCSDAVPDASAEAAAVPDPTPAEPLSVSMDGTLALGNCAASGADCTLNVGDPTDPERAANLVHVPFQGSAGMVADATATLTWTATSPLTEELGLRVSLLKGCPGACSTDEVLLEVQGTSPLTIELPGAAVPNDRTLGFTVLRAEFFDSGQRLSLLQDFHLDGAAQPN